MKLALKIEESYFKVLCFRRFHKQSQSWQALGSFHPKKGTNKLKLAYFTFLKQ